MDFTFGHECANIPICVVRKGQVVHLANNESVAVEWKILVLHLKRFASFCLWWSGGTSGIDVLW